MTPPVRWRLRIARDGSPYFVQKAENGRVLSASELYSSEQAANDGARASGCPEDQLPLAPEETENP